MTLKSATPTGGFDFNIGSTDTAEVQNLSGRAIGEIDLMKRRVMPISELLTTERRGDGSEGRKQTATVGRKSSSRSTLFLAALTEGIANRSKQI